MSNFKKLTKESFSSYTASLEVKRKIKLVQIHHTYSPSYEQFTGENHERLQENMRLYHVNTKKWTDIGQHFTIFPDGVIMTGRSLSLNPAGIYGANTGAICIECLGNFDKDGNIMTKAQEEAIVCVVKTLLDRLSLSAADDVTYHAWWSADGKYLGDYVKGKSAKTCPGTAFFGGNTKKAYKENLLPLIENYGKNKLLEVETVNDIIWELANAKIITDSSLWMKKCEEDKNVYWLCRKMANKLRGVF